LIKQSGKQSLKAYFDLLESYQQENYGKMKEVIEKYLEKISAEKKPRTTFDFSDVLKFLESKPDGKRKSLLSILIRLLRGELDREEAKKKILESENMGSAR
jgi:hypothetical protein